MKSQHKLNLHHILIIILGLVLSIGWIYPFFIIFIGSLKTRGEIFTDPVGLPADPVWENYRTAWENMDYETSFMNSVVITVVSVVLIVIFAAMAAYALSRVNNRISRLIYLFCAVLMLVPFPTLMIPLVTLFGQINLINRVGLIIMNVGFGLNLAIFLYYGALQSVPLSMDEAAKLDGASRFRTFWDIIFPSLRSTTATVVILSTIRIWNDYLLPSLVINQEGMRTIPLQMYSFFGEYTVQWELALAALVLSIIPVIILYIFLQRYIVRGVTAGAVKAG